MQNYSILFLDIDGTILDDENRVSASLKQLFRKLGNEGIPVILNSSRSPGGMLEFRKETGMQNPYVSYGGSLILDGNDRILFETGIPLERAVQLFRFIRGLKADISVSYYVYDVWMTDCISHPAVCREAKITGCSPVECDFENLSGSVNCVHKILCIGGHEDLERIAEGNTRGFSDMVFAFSKDDYLEIVSKEVSKGAAVRELCRRLNIPLKEAAACGDGMVDLSMLEEAGLGIAMGNAPAALKLAADLVTLSNENDGAYAALKNLSFRRCCGRGIL